MKYSEQPMVSRVKRGVMFGLVISTALSTWAGVAFSLKSRAQVDSLHLTLTETVAAYFAGGIFGGAFVGAAFPLTRSAIGAFFLGFIANLPTAAMVTHFMADSLPLAAQFVISCIVACIGGTVALFIRSDPWPE